MEITGSFKKDYNMGTKAEQKLLPIINSKFNLELSLSEKKNASFDFIDEKNKVVVELKTRRCEKLKYSTTIVPKHKYDVGIGLLKDGWRVIYVFNFTDKVCFIEPGEKEYEVKIQGRRDRGKFEYIPHINFLVDDLIDF